jgi:hypothetical protein
VENGIVLKRGLGDWHCFRESRLTAERQRQGELIAAERFVSRVRLSNVCFERSHACFLTGDVLTGHSMQHRQIVPVICQAGARARPCSQSNDFELDGNCGSKISVRFVLPKLQTEVQESFFIVFHLPPPPIAAASFRVTETQLPVSEPDRELSFPQADLLRQLLPEASYLTAPCARQRMQKRRQLSCPTGFRNFFLHFIHIASNYAVNTYVFVATCGFRKGLTFYLHKRNFLCSGGRYLTCHFSQ